jgi:hypothetical protein
MQNNPHKKRDIIRDENGDVVKVIFHDDNMNNSHTINNRNRFMTQSLSSIPTQTSHNFTKTIDNVKTTDTNIDVNDINNVNVDNNVITIDHDTIVNVMQNLNNLKDDEDIKVQKYADKNNVPIEQDNVKSTNDEDRSTNEENNSYVESEIKDNETTDVVKQNTEDTNNEQNIEDTNNEQNIEDTNNELNEQDTNNEQNNVDVDDQIIVNDIIDEDGNKVDGCQIYYCYYDGRDVPEKIYNVGDYFFHCKQYKNFSVIVDQDKITYVKDNNDNIYRVGEGETVDQKVRDLNLEDESMLINIDQNKDNNIDKKKINMIDGVIVKNIDVTDNIDTPTTPIMNYHDTIPTKDLMRYRSILEQDDIFQVNAEIFTDESIGTYLSVLTNESTTRLLTTSLATISDSTQIDITHVSTSCEEEVRDTNDVVNIASNIIDLDIPLNDRSTIPSFTSKNIKDGDSKYIVDINVNGNKEEISSINKILTKEISNINNTFDSEVYLLEQRRGEQKDDVHTRFLKVFYRLKSKFIEAHKNKKKFCELFDSSYIVNGKRVVLTDLADYRVVFRPEHKAIRLFDKILKSKGWTMYIDFYESMMCISMTNV